MIAEAGTMEVRSSGARDAGRRDFESTLQRETGTFLSTHLLRELIAADARCEAAGDPLAERADALLGVVLHGLELSDGAIVQVTAGGEGLCLAAQGIPDHARQLLEARQAHLESVGGSLARRALSERRVLLLDRSTRDPLMPALRDANPDIEYAAVVPLIDHDLAAGVLVLAARGGRLSPALLRSLAVAFRLLGVLLGPARGQAPAVARLDEPGRAAADVERDRFEIEELSARLAESREAAHRIGERSSATEASLRAEVETLRARTAELEAQLAGVPAPAAREHELEALLAEQSRLLSEHENRVVELEREIGMLLQRIELLQSGVVESNGTRAWPDDDSTEDAVGELTLDAIDEPAAESPTTIDLSESVDEQLDEQLGDIAAAAVAALDDAGADDVVEASPDEESYEGELELDVTPSEPEREPVAAPVPSAAPGYAQAVLHLDSWEAARDVVRASSDDAGAAYWSGDGEAPAAGSPIVAVNLLDEQLAQAAASDDRLWAAPRWIVYGADPEGGLGFELGSCALLRRPIEPRVCLEQIQRKAGRKLNGILLVSAQLRELAPLRQTLQEADAAGSVACDARQALDLLEIVRRPDAVMIDLALPQGQGLALAAQLRRQPETSDLPLVLLLPATVEPMRLRAEADKAQMLGAFGVEHLQRLVRTMLAGRG